MTAEAFKHERIKVFVDRDVPLRAREYAVVVHDRETDEETGAFTFYVSDSGKQVRIGEFVDAARFGVNFP